MKIKSSGDAPPNVDMTPMIDIVFQLIAFFMVISNFEQQQADERVSLPKDQLAKPPATKRENALTLNIGFIKDDNGAFIDKNPFIFFPDGQVRVADCRQKLQQEANFYKTIGTNLEDVTIEIRADADVQTGLVQDLIQICQETGYEEQRFQRFALKATQQE